MTLIRRISAIVLVGLTIGPAHLQAQRTRPADVLDRTKRLGTDALLWAAARRLGIKDPVAERKLTGADLARAAAARRLFESGYAAGRGGAYDPADAERARELTARYRTVAQRIGGRKAPAAADLNDLREALLPFLRHLATVDSDGPNTVVVLPDQVRRVTFQTYCMDLDAPAPRPDENIHLVRRERLIPTYGATVYSALMRYSARNPRQRAVVQNFVWGMRHARAGAPFLRELTPQQETTLEVAMTGGAARYRQYLSREMQAGQIDEIKTKIFHRAVAELEQSIGRPLPPPSRSGYAVTDVNTALRYLQEAAVTDGSVTPDSNYTSLAPGVAVRSVSGKVGVGTTQFELLNRSCEPYTFNGDDYVGQSTRVTQRLALGGVVGPSRDEARAALVKALGADTLKALEGKLGTSSDPLAKLLLTAVQVVRGPSGVATAMDVAHALAAASGALVDCLPRNACDLARRLADLSESGGKGLSKADQRKLQELSRLLLGALAKLGTYRDAFLRDGKPVNVFPTAYYHVTATEMERIANGEFVRPIEKVEQLLAFFSAYESNRRAYETGGAVEPHWKTHFDKARPEGGATWDDYRRALDSGITAHVDNDLPRALRDSYDHRFHREATLDELGPDFTKTNDTLFRADGPTSADLLSKLLVPDRIGIPVGATIANLVGHRKTEQVIDRRGTAWERAFGGGALPTGAAPQPPLDRAALARAADAACGPAGRR
jgi:hypothetical protein